MTFPVSFYHHQANDPSVNFDEVENRVEALEEVSLDVKTWVAAAAGGSRVRGARLEGPPAGGAGSGRG